MNASLWQLAGWTMIHSLWLGAAVALAGGFFRLAARRAAPNTRYAISLATLATLAATPLAAAAWLGVNGVPQLAAVNISESILLPLPLQHYSSASVAAGKLGDLQKRGVRVHACLETSLTLAGDKPWNANSGWHCTDSLGNSADRRGSR